MTAPYFDFDAAAPARPLRSAYVSGGKRLLDLFLLLAAAPVVLPVVALFALIVGAQGGNPFYSQLRVGRHGRMFRCWKLRTMVPDADAVLLRLVAENSEIAEEWTRFQKLRNDPRITRIGRFLRRSSLDELPQLWNVFTGDMSLVGPRPFTPEQKPLYLGGRRDASYFRLRPGITGLWQVGRRNEASFAERAVADHDYAETLSFRTDVRIILQTVAVVLRGTGV